MANIGVCKPYYAKYSAANGVVTYTTPTALGRATSVDITTEGKDPAILYADNGPVEAVPTFGGGNATIGIDQLSLEVAKDVLGYGTGSAADGITLEVDKVAPYVGLGFIAKQIYNGVLKWRMICLTKCQAKVPDISLTTQGETVEFQTPSLEFTIMRDDNAVPGWSHWQDYTTEADALAAMVHFFGG